MSMIFSDDDSCANCLHLKEQIEAEKRLYVQNDTYLRDQLKQKDLQIDELKKKADGTYLVCNYHHLPGCICGRKIQELERLNGELLEVLRRAARWVRKEPLTEEEARDERETLGLVMAALAKVGQSEKRNHED